MNSNEDFDCVLMKNEIQVKLLEEYRGLSEEEIRRRRRERILSNPLLKEALESSVVSTQEEG